MKPRHTHLAFAAVAFAILGGGIAALRFIPDLPETAKKTMQAGVALLPGLADLAEKPAPAPQQLAAPEPRRPVIKHVKATPPDPPAPREPPPSTISALESLPPLSPQPSADAPTLPLDETAESGVEGEVSLPAPLPPPRPADLANLAKLSTPLPPRRPWDLAALLPSAPAPAAPEPQKPDAEDAATQPQEAKPQPLEHQQGAEPQATQPAPTEQAPTSSPPAEPNAASPAPTPVAVSSAPLPPSRPADLGALIAARGPDGAAAPSVEEPARFSIGSPVFIRIFKQEGQLELYLRKTDGRLALYKTYPICKWSGHLGPKLREADYQSPEGFYSVSAKQLHPHSNYHRAFNVGYPNAFDRQNGRTGGLVMVHGACKSVGCFAMTDAGIEEIYGFVDAALRVGQKEIPVHIFPFRMTEHAIAKETGGHWLAFAAASNNAQWGAFWRNLKEGYDLFEQTGEPPVAYACGDRYSFGSAGASCQRVAGW